MKQVFLNGRFLPENEACIPVMDRSFLYGDGLFETMRVYDLRAFRWTDHLRRLQAGAEVLGIRIPFADEALAAFATELIQRNAEPESVLRLHLSRGVGPRGYSVRGADAPTVVMTTHPVIRPDPARPLRWKLTVSSFHLAGEGRLASFKTANKLVSILARAEAEARGFDEALLTNPAGDVVEASSSNVFWIEGGVVCTPPLDSGALPGVTRAVVLELARELGLPTDERRGAVDRLRVSDGVFLTLSSLEIVPVVQLDGQTLAESPVVRRLHEAYRGYVRREA